MKKVKIGYISLGCPRNLVDTEVMIGILKKAGHSIEEDPEGADIVLINTCGFIEDAKKESIDIILQVIELKKKGRVGKIVLAGCLCQRYGDQFKKEFKEIDAFIGTGDTEKIETVVNDLLKDKGSFFISKPNSLYSSNSPRYLLTPPHYKYLKISEGCSNRCSYCVIPAIKGPHRSRHIEDIIAEAEKFVKEKTTRELNIIGQDTTLYGKDIYGEIRIEQLLKKICRLKDEIWVRLLYTHPAHVSDKLIELFAEEKNLCKYIDLPIQHINDKVLKDMRRGVSREHILKLLDKIRKVDKIAVRTSVIVGFPGETEQDFNELMEFLKVARFERLGAFIYSREEGTPACKFPDQVSEEQKQSRLHKLMVLQRQISEENNSKLLGKEVEVLIEDKDPNSSDVYIGRSQYDAPEVDGCVYVKAEDLKPGDLVKAKVVDTLEYDLVTTLI